jgi:hypothetical protein
MVVGQSSPPISCRRLCLAPNGDHLEISIGLLALPCSLFIPLVCNSSPLIGIWRALLSARRRTSRNHKL